MGFHKEVYHWVPSHVESYLQEAGRDGQPAIAILSSDFKFHTIKLMNEYYQNASTCRRELLLVNFDLDELALNSFYCCIKNWTELLA